MVGLVKSVSSTLADMAVASLEEQKKILYEPSKFTDNKPLFARLWDLFIILMIGYFLKSIVDGEVKEKAIEIATKGKVHHHE